MTTQLVLRQVEELEKTQLPCGVCIWRNDKKRVVIVDKTLVVFTPTEYRLLLLLLNGSIIDDIILIETFSCQEMNKATRNLLKKHIENTKGKLNVLGLDIYRVYRKGYVLMGAETTS